MTMRDYIRIGEWMHVAAVAGPEDMKFYINGNLVGSDPLSVSIDAFGDERSAARGFIVGDVNYSPCGNAVRMSNC